MQSSHSETDSCTEEGVPVLEDKAVVNAEDAARSIRSGLSDEALMEKYEISQTGLENLSRKLVAAGAIEQSDLDLRRVSLRVSSLILSPRNPSRLGNVEKEGEEAAAPSSEDRSIREEHKHNSPRLAALLWDDCLFFWA